MLEQSQGPPWLTDVDIDHESAEGVLHISLVDVITQVTNIYLHQMLANRSCPPAAETLQPSAIVRQKLAKKNLGS